MAGSVPPVPPVGTIASTPTSTRERPAAEPTAPPPPASAPVAEDPVDTLETVARVPVDAPVAVLPEALLTLPADTVLEGIVTRVPDQALPRIETDFGALTALSNAPLPEGRVVSLQIQSADLHVVTVPIALDDKLPAPSFPTVLTLAAMPDLEPPQTEDDNRLRAIVAVPAAALAPEKLAGGEQPAEASPRELPRQGLPAPIANLPVGARIAGTLLPVAAANKFLFVVPDAVLGLTLPHQPVSAEAIARPLATPDTGTRLLLEIRGVAEHINAKLVAVAGVQLTDAKTPVILGPAPAPPAVQMAEQPTTRNTVSTAAQLPRPGLSIGETVRATVHIPPSGAEAHSPTDTRSPLPSTAFSLTLRGYGETSVIGTATPVAAGKGTIAGTSLVPGGLVTATVVGHDHQGALLVGIGDRTLRLETAAPFPPGTNLTFEVLPAPPPDLSVLGPPPEGVATRLQLDSLAQVIQALAVADPHAQGATIAAALPNAGGGAVAKLIAYLFAMKSGDARQWLGERAAAALERIGRGALLGRLGDELRLVERGLSDPAGEWRQLPLPFQDGDRLGMVTAWLYDGRRGRGDGAEDQADDETRVIIDLSLSRLGDIRLDGTYRPGRFDITIASEAPFEDPVRYNMIQIFDDILAVSGMAGALSFRAHASDG